jgi:hypothetical protein
MYQHGTYFREIAAVVLYIVFQYTMKYIQTKKKKQKIYVFVKIAISNLVKHCLPL